MILSVETSTRSFSIYIEKGEMYANIEIIFNITHSQGIVQSVDFLLKRVGEKLESIKKVYADVGPGSFTGIRVGLSFANTLAQALKIPLAGLSSLDILSFEVNEWESPIIPFMRSGKGEVYASFYSNGKRMEDYKIFKAGDFINYIDSKKPDYLISSKEDYNDLIGSLNNSYNDLKNDFKIIYSYPKAKIIPTIISKKGRKVSRAYLKPIYVKNF